MKRCLREFKILGLRWIITDRYRISLARFAWWLESCSTWLQRCYVCRDSGYRLCENCRRFVCVDHADQNHDWDDCDICQECGDAIGDDCLVEEEVEAE